VKKPVRVATLLLATMIAVFVPGVPAFAHTTVKSSVPAANASVKAVPTTVTLTFSERLSILPKVSVEDSAGNIINSGKATLDGAVITQPVTPTVAGKYTVKWSAVAQDGDRSTGSFGFTLAVTPPPPPSPTPPPTTAAAAPTSASQAAPLAASESSSSSTWWIWVLAGALILAFVVVFTVVRRKRV
jgi:methionine-rich copper-binding protein CopC